MLKDLRKVATESLAYNVNRLYVKDNHCNPRVSSDYGHIIKLAKGSLVNKTRRSFFLGSGNFFNLVTKISSLRHGGQKKTGAVKCCFF